MALADFIQANFGVPSPGAVNDKIIAYYKVIFTGLGSPVGVVTGPGFYFDLTNFNMWKNAAADNSSWTEFNTGSVIPAYPLLAPNGTVAAPSYSFASAPSSGFYRSAANQVSYSANGTEVLRFNANAVVSIISNDLQVNNGNSIRIQSNGVSGSLFFGATNDVRFYRSAANTLALDDGAGGNAGALTAFGNLSAQQGGVSQVTIGIVAGQPGINMFQARIYRSGNGVLTMDNNAGGAVTLDNPTGFTLVGTGHPLGFYGATPVAQPLAIPAPSGGAVVDTQARAAIASILNAIGAGAGGIGITA